MIDVDALRISSGTELPARPSGKPRLDGGLPKHKKGELFLKGPIPWTWLRGAARLPGKALAVAVALWQVAAAKKTPTVPLRSTLVRQLGIKRDAARRGLAALERAGLVSVRRHRGKQPRVTILEAHHVAPDVKQSVVTPIDPSDSPAAAEA